MKIFIQIISDSKECAGAWDHDPSLEERLIAYNDKNPDLKHPLEINNLQYRTYITSCEYYQ